MQDVHEGWGERIAELLAELGKPLAWLAAECEVNPSTVTRIVQGRMCPNEELKWKIAGVLGVRMDRLWEWPKMVPPHPQTGQRAA